MGAQHAVVGYECDGCQFEMKNGVPVPTLRDGTPETFEILGTGAGGPQHCRQLDRYCRRRALRWKARAGRIPSRVRPYWEATPGEAPS